MKREKISQIKELIIDESISFIEQNGNLSRIFYEDADLIKKVGDTFNIIASKRTRKWGITSSEDFNNFFLVALKEFKTTHPITVTESVSLKKNKITWLGEKEKVEVGWDNDMDITTYRDRYFEYLKRLGRSEKYILENKRSSLSIVEKLANPKSEVEILAKGVVVGSVQSGKTANFNGVINSAIDLGYRLIIVLSGITEDLREQTQIRIENDVIGDKIGSDKDGNEIWNGVGSVAPFKIEEQKIVVRSITSPSSDFKRGLLDASFSLNNYNIMICKKNVSILNNIIIWLNESKGNPKKLDIPFIIIDDEADNASLNNMGYKGKEYATKINMQIRALLDLFSVRSYLGYTATPFANILQDRNEKGEKKYIINSNQPNINFSMISNLFPDDFIDLLYPPSNYVGIKNYFDTRESDINKIESLIADPIDDYLNSFPPRFNKEDNTPTFSKEKGTRAANQNDLYPKVLPNSIKEAIQCYILSIAVRLSRKQEMSESDLYQPHHSMLIHISRFGTWQNSTKDLIIEYLEGNLDKNILGLFGLIKNVKKDSETIQELERIWEKYYLYIVNNIKTYLPNGYEDDFMKPTEFKTIRGFLNEAIKNIEVKAINSITKDKLYYPSKKDKNFSEKKYIAIGGNRLSRGFTLEGLTINYFIRGTDNADTLMQMGRWFGYRPGYLDCCKLFTTFEAIEKFNEASLIIENLEKKIEQLSKLPDRSPSDFTLWIRNNPGVLKLTRGNFLKNLKTLSLEFSDTIQQSTQFTIEKSQIEKSFNAFCRHVNGLDWESSEEFLIHNTNQEGLLKFIDLPNTMNNLNTLGLKGFLNNCNSQGKLQNWVIAIKKIKKGEGSLLKSSQSGLLYDLKLITRRGPNINEDSSRSALLKHNIFKAKKSTIITPSDFSITLNFKEKKIAVEEFRHLKKVEFVKNGNSEIEANIKAKDIAIPDYVYRSAMDESTGILVIYLMDIQKVFEAEKGIIDVELTKYKIHNGFENFNLPLIGFALGFPTVRGVDSNKYITQHLFEQPFNQMSISELKEYIKDNNFDIDISLNWNQKDLINEIEEYINATEDSEEFDDQTLTQ